MRIGFMKKVLILIFLIFFTHPVFAYMTDDYFLNRKFDELEQKVNDLEQKQIQTEIQNLYKPKYYYHNSKELKHLNFDKKTQGIPRYSDVKHEDKYNGLMEYDYEIANQEYGNPIYSSFDSVSEDFKEGEYPKSQYEMEIENKPLLLSNDLTLQEQKQDTTKLDKVGIFLIASLITLIVFIFCLILKFKILKLKT